MAGEDYNIPGSYLADLKDLRVEVKERDGTISRGYLVSAGSKFILLQDGGILSRVMIMCHNIARIQVIGDKR